MVPGFLREPRGGTHYQKSQTSFLTMSPLKLPGGVRIRTFHINYVAGYTDPLLFLVERTYTN